MYMSVHRGQTKASHIHVYEYPQRPQGIRPTCVWVSTEARWEHHTYMCIRSVHRDQSRASHIHVYEECPQRPEGIRPQTPLDLDLEGQFGSSGRIPDAFKHQALSAQTPRNIILSIFYRWGSWDSEKILSQVFHSSYHSILLVRNTDPQVHFISYCEAVLGFYQYIDAW